MEGENHKEKALNLLRSRICDPKFIFSDSPDGNYRSLLSSSPQNNNNVSLSLSLSPSSHFKIKSAKIDEPLTVTVWSISKLKFMVSSSVTEACNNSILLLGPRGSGKIAVCPHTLINLYSRVSVSSVLFSPYLLLLGFGACHSRFVAPIPRLSFSGIYYSMFITSNKIK